MLGKVCFFNRNKKKARQKLKESEGAQPQASRNPGWPGKEVGDSK